MHLDDPTADRTQTERLINQLNPAIQAVLEFCQVSLLQFPTGNALLITWCSADCINVILLRQMHKIAQIVQAECGNTQIYLRHCQKPLIMHWDSYQLVQKTVQDAP